MISHTLITLPIVAVGLLLHWWLGWPATLAAWTMTIWWLSREQYWEERGLRDEVREGVRDDARWWIVLISLARIFRPMERNLDFIVPTAVAWAMTGGYAWWLA